MLCGSGFNGRFFKTQPSHIRVKFADISLSNGSTIPPLLVGPSDNLVVNIGEVPDKGDIVSTISKITINGIEDDCGASMANMTEVIDRYPTDIHPHLFPIKRDEIFIAILIRRMTLSLPRRGKVLANSGPFIFPVTAARRGA